MAQRGFTLIELLVAMVIIATLTTMVSLTVDRSQSQQFLSQARQLQAWLNNLPTQAILGSSVWGVRLHENGAKALILVDNRWTPALAVEAFELPEFISLSHLLETTSPVENTPQLLVLPNGQFLPASQLQLHSHNDRATLRWDQTARAELELTSAP